MRCSAWMILTVIVLLSVCLASAQSPHQERESKDQKFKDSYSLGYEFGANLRLRGVAVDTDVLFSAIQAALEGKQPLLGSADIRETLNELTRKIAVTQGLKFKKYAAKNLEQSKAFMETNKSKAGVETLPDGLQFKVLREGSGPVPKSSDIVKVRYQGTLTDGTEVDTADQAFIGRVDEMTKGRSEALQLMKVGSKWHLFVPPSLGYGARRFRRVPPNSVLIYEIELMSIEKTFPVGPDPPAAVQSSGVK
jgi:FKBP-type peptidyl-prolyl cis-trans isomerase FklB